jgi:hypothetical protein
MEYANMYSKSYAGDQVVRDWDTSLAAGMAASDTNHVVATG